MALSYPTPGILISSGFFTLKALKKKDMYPSYISIISIKHLCFIQCVCLILFLSIFYNRPVDIPPFNLEFLEPAPSLTPPHACTGPALYASGGRRALLGLTSVLLRVNRLIALLSDHRSG
jgi:hypothetical protein